MASMPAFRRVVTTVASRDGKGSIPASTLQSRKSFTSTSTKHRPTSPAVIALFTAVVFIACMFLAQVAPLCPSGQLKLIPSLERWRDPHYARERLAIYVYELPSKFNTDLVERSIEHPPPIRDPRCDTNFYSSEVHVHRFLLDSPVRTLDPEKADFFYVPVYTTCDLLTHHPNDVPRVGRNFAEAMGIVMKEYPFWNRSNGRDHVYLFSQGFSARLAGEWERYSNGIFMVHNGEFTAPEFTPHKDFVIPPELRAYFEPFWTEGANVVEAKPRKYLGQFGGQVVNINVSDHRGSNYSGGVRQYIQGNLMNEEGYRITGVRSKTYISDMKNSKFCLAPEGWHPWSPRPYYSVLMGCIPVIISEVQELAFEEFIDWDRFVVWVRPRDISNLDAILQSISDKDIQRRRAALKDVWKSLWYAGDGLANQAILRALYARKYRSAPKRVFSSV